MESRIHPELGADVRPAPSEARGVAAWEFTGFLAGFAGCACLAAQLIAEWRAATTSLSPVNTVGFLIIFAFWAAYGFRFGRKAMWITNGVAVVLQAGLIIVSLSKLAR
ncbi:hypothetical protein [Accumulibacter sp.]|uniref:hypothetical protein n=1 Tax=Accumulibacter sp. TaxID=2053492 RepID=UPI001AD47FA6|nr:hypothetical protein [Accumulibacter sp.]MBN8216453.1 hypothetical protein [Spirochaetota bacterium]MBN8455038.1 hypothetical protein [Accumulibacter sp.]